MVLSFFFIILWSYYSRDVVTGDSWLPAGVVTKGGFKVKCEVCGKEYQTRSGLRRHMKSVHGDVKPAGESGGKDQESEGGGSLADYMQGSDPVRAACKELGIKLKDVLSYKVYDDKVVIIEGPTGWKRVWQRK